MAESVTDGLADATEIPVAVVLALGRIRDGCGATDDMMLDCVSRCSK
jgi:hypothetical protein